VNLKPVSVFLDFLDTLHQRFTQEPERLARIEEAIASVESLRNVFQEPLTKADYVAAFYNVSDLDVQIVSDTIFVHGVDLDFWLTGEQYKKHLVFESTLGNAHIKLIGKKEVPRDDTPSTCLF